MMHVSHVKGPEAALIIMAERSDLMACRSKAGLEDRLWRDLDVFFASATLLVDAANETNLHSNPPAGPWESEGRTLAVTGLLF